MLAYIPAPWILWDSAGELSPHLRTATALGDTEAKRGPSVRVRVDVGRGLVDWPLGRGRGDPEAVIERIRKVGGHRENYTKLKWLMMVTIMVIIRIKLIPSTGSSFSPNNG